MIIRIALVLVCVSAALAAALAGDDPLEDWSSELLWLSINVIIVTLAVEALLGADLKRRRRDNLTFAFQTRVALLAEDLLSLVTESREPGPEAPLLAIGESRQDFARSVSSAALYVGKATALKVDRYDDVYSAVWKVLDDLSRTFVRLFSRDREAMLENFREIDRIARHWRYQDALSPLAVAELARLQAAAADHPEEDWDAERAAAALARFEAARAAALALVAETGVVLIEILRRSGGPLVELAD